MVGTALAFGLSSDNVLWLSVTAFDLKLFTHTGAYVHHVCFGLSVTLREQT